MLQDPRIGFGIELLKGPILSKAKFIIKTKDKRVKEYIIRQITRFWRNGAKTSLNSIIYGFSGSEVIYKYNHNTGYIEYKKLKHLRSLDTRPVTRDDEMIAMQVGSIKSDSGKGFVYLPKQKYLWAVHDETFNRWYGRSRLLRAFIPWHEQWMPEGYRDIRQLWFYKNAYQGVTIKFPSGSTPDENGTMIPNALIAQEMADKSATGSSLLLPKSPDDSQSWEAEQAKGVAIPDGLLDYGDKLGSEIWEALGIPPEVIESDGTGAFNGRKVPQQAFFSILQEMISEQITAFNECVLEGLVALNFGSSVEYEIEPVSLLDIMQQEEMGAITGQPKNAPNEHNVQEQQMVNNQQPQGVEQ